VFWFKGSTTSSLALLLALPEYRIEAGILHPSSFPNSISRLTSSFYDEEEDEKGPDTI
jgi:hypothetical protein